MILCKGKSLRFVTRAAVGVLAVGGLLFGGLSMSPSVIAAGRVSVERGATGEGRSAQIPAGLRSAIVAGGMAIIYREWPESAEGYNDFEMSTTVTKDPGYNGHTYWAHEWSYSNGGDGGYVGLQRKSADEKALNFSIWEASGWRDAAPEANCSNFSHEGSGVQCWIDYPWKEGVKYNIKVAKVDSKGWRASITDTESGETSSVATIELPQDFGGLNTLSEWVENFAQGDEQPENCEDVPSAVAVYDQPTANDGAVKPLKSSPSTYGECKSIAEAVCTPEQSCTLTVNKNAQQARRPSP
ncbi:DUF3472 domain-containing protein [Streptomyces sp. NPDC059008]|uniref:DUF3472 domain-containing protein n=1 Tax=Streptomyces sp. NPDC059008 TaxID=3346693 RepID=UPI0036847838